MSSKKQRKEKQQIRVNKDKLRSMEKVLGEKDVLPFELEPWMGHSHHIFYKLDDIYAVLNLEGIVEGANLLGRNIGCPTDIIIVEFDKEMVRYEIDGEVKIGRTRDFLVKVGE